MQAKKPRARRYSFVTAIEITDVLTEVQWIEQTRNLSLFGCHVNTPEPLKAGTKVRIRIAHNSAVFSALGRVANVRPNARMGIVFTEIEAHDQAILENWLEELRNR